MYSQHLEQWPELVIDLFMKWLYYSFMGNVFDHLRPTFVHFELSYRSAAANRNPNTAH